MTDHTQATFFEAPAEFGRWLTANHAIETELWVGFHRRAAGRPSLTWAESVDEALCVGWIDGVRKGIDAERYAIRFTPRQRTSTRSAVSVRRVPEPSSRPVSRRTLRHPPSSRPSRLGTAGRRRTG